MGYFLNGTEAERYFEKYCYNCKFYNEKRGCPIIDAHWLYNYEECNNKDSILHMLIPRDEKGYNNKCNFYIPSDVERLLKEERANG